MNSYSSVLKHIATLGPVGYMPIAPGTFGTLLAVAFIAILKPPTGVYIAIMLIVLILGTLASHRAEKLFNVKDPQRVVIDEFTGYFFSMAFLPQGNAYLLSSFILFRFLDILKPPPIRKIERLSGGAGIMADDLIAGFYTNVILQIWKIFLQS